MMRRPPCASATWWPPELKPTKRPLLEDHLEPELNPARVVRVDERERVALKLVWPGGFESLQVKGTVQQVQCGAGVRAGQGQGLDRRKSVPDLVEVHPVEDIGSVRDEVKPDSTVPENVHRLLYSQIQRVVGVSSGRVTTGIPRSGEIGVKRWKAVSKRRHSECEGNAGSQGQDGSENHVSKDPGKEVVLRARLEWRAVYRVHREDMWEVEHGHGPECIQPGGSE